MRHIFFISDGTGISIETIGKSLMTQFEGIPFKIITYRYIDTIEKAKNLNDTINALAKTQQHRPILLCTIADMPIRNILKKTEGLVIDFFENAIPKLEQELSQKATGTMGLSHAIIDNENYNSRMDAVNFSLNYDDGISVRGYPAADIILLGVSRTGKTPTCLYLAMQYGLNAANYPLTEEDLQQDQLPHQLLPFKKQLFGLTIAPQRLQEIRQKRKANSRYASLEQCQFEIANAEIIYRYAQIPFLNSTYLSIEELATQIMEKAQLNSRLSN